MKYLLDTCTFLWIIAGAEELSPAVKELFTNPANEVLLSVVSVWELSVKHSLGKLPYPMRLNILWWSNENDMGLRCFHLMNEPSSISTSFQRCTAIRLTGCLSAKPSNIIAFC